jgi:tetratricopeptide (TPR) repeat protein
MDFLSPDPSGNRNAYVEVYLAGCQAFQSQNWDLAVSCLEKAKALYPTEVCPWELLALSLANQGRFDESLRAFEKVHELNHECPTCCYNRWIVCRQLGRLQEGLKALERLLELEPKNSQGWFEHGLALGGFLGLVGGEIGTAAPFDGRHERSVESFQKAVALDPTMYDAWVCMGIVLTQLACAANAGMAFSADARSDYKRRFQQARAVFDYAISIRPDAPRAWFHKGELLVDIENNSQLDEEACSLFTKVVELDPKNAEAWYKRFAACLRTGNNSLGLESLRKAVLLDSGYGEKARREFPLLANDDAFQPFVKRK